MGQKVKKTRKEGIGTEAKIGKQDYEKRKGHEVFPDLDSRFGKLDPCLWVCCTSMCTCIKYLN